MNLHLTLYRALIERLIGLKNWSITGGYYNNFELL